MITVFYDGKCGLCSKEIRHYQKIAPQGIFNWQDVNELSEAELKKNNINLVETLKILHAQDTNGIFYKGVDAFIIIWSNLNRWKILAKIVSFYPIKILANFIYNIFAEYRFKKLAHCKLALNKEKNL